ncbi:hypothetical protein SCA6_016604 [Theobroma cacao]
METKVGRIKLGPQGQEISEQGLGCSSMSAFYGPPKREPDMINLIHHAINSGVTFLDTFDVYGPHTNDILLGKALKDIRDRIELATKFGACTVDGRREFRGDPAYVREACEGGLKRLGVENIDLYYQHRVDTRFPSKSRFQPENLGHNKHLFERVNEMARRKGCSPITACISLDPSSRGWDDVCPNTWNH